MASPPGQQPPQQLSVVPYPAVVEFAPTPGTYQLSPQPLIACSEALAERAAQLAAGLRTRFGVPANLQQQQQQQQPAGAANPAADPAAAAASQQPCITLQLLEELPALQGMRWGAAEGYVLHCSEAGVVLSALSSAGIFYGVQTLLQALQPCSHERALCLPHVKVVDAPRFMWRGVLLDAGRHFFPLPFLLRLLDLMALYKLNRFHWHLTEDQGWRLEVPSLPRLAEVAAWRGRRPAAAAAAPAPGSAEQQQQHDSDSVRRSLEQQQQQSEAEQQEQPDPRRSFKLLLQQSQEQRAQEQQQQQAAAAAAGAGSAAGARNPASVLGRPPPSAAVFHGGFYSQADVAKVIAYAAERCIEVVPEIELPGHCVAALAAYPHLSCTGNVAAVSTHWGIHEDVYCAGSEEAFGFLQTVLDQVVRQFPCSYIHIGGDEVPKVRWEECARCQQRMQQEGLGSEAELQSWFVRRISQHLAQHGRRIIGWDEILEGGLAEGATVMSWRGNVGGIIAAKSGHDVIMTPTSHCYFDYRQSPSPAEPGAWYACLPLHVVYSYDPIPGPWAEELAAARGGGGGGGGSDGQEQQGSGGSSLSEDAPSSAGAGAAAGAAGDALMASPPGSSADDDGSPMSRTTEGASGGGAAAATTAAAAAAAGATRGSSCCSMQDADASAGAGAEGAAAVAAPDAVQAAGPHYPGHPPGASLAPLAAAATAGGSGAPQPAAPPGCSGGAAGARGQQQAAALTEAEAEHILGSQANLWTEYVADEATAEYMLLPRLAALAESIWTPVESKDWCRFVARLQDHHLPLLDQLGYLYRPLGP